MILYTTVEGGHWIPFNTPMNEDSLLYRVQRVAMYHACINDRCDAKLGLYPQLLEEDHICTRPSIGVGVAPDKLHWRCATLFVPVDDSLPQFHSILTRNNWRWDAQNERWFPFNCSSDFHQWWNTYIQNWRPFEDDDEREHVWKDQMHPNEDLREMIERSR